MSDGEGGENGADVGELGDGDADVGELSDAEGGSDGEGPSSQSCGLYGLVCREGFHCSSEGMEESIHHGDGEGGFCLGNPKYIPKSTVIKEDPVVFVPGGRFFMGCEATESPGQMGSELSCPNKQQMLHEVKVSPFAMDLTPVTREAYKLCLTLSGCITPHMSDEDVGTGRPMNSVTWDEAKAYCKWQGKRLPTEAEWELAARGGCDTLPEGDCRDEMRPFPWGDLEGGLEISGYANFSSFFDQGQLKSVTSHPKGRSPYGLYDMLGNVDEWVYDFWKADYDESESEPYFEEDSEDSVENSTDPTGPEDGSSRVIRGGNYKSLTSIVHGSMRAKSPQNTRAPTLGFRCVRDVPRTLEER